MSTINQQKPEEDNAPGNIQGENLIPNQNFCGRCSKILPLTQAIFETNCHHLFCGECLGMWSMLRIPFCDICRKIRPWVYKRRLLELNYVKGRCMCEKCL